VVLTLLPLLWFLQRHPSIHLVLVTDDFVRYHIVKFAAQVVSLIPHIQFCLLRMRRIIMGSSSLPMRRWHRLATRTDGTTWNNFLGFSGCWFGRLVVSSNVGKTNPVVVDIPWSTFHCDVPWTNPNPRIYRRVYQPPKKDVRHYTHFVSRIGP